MTIRTFENKTPEIHATTFVDETALVLGDVKIGENCSIWPLTVIRGDVNRIEIGDCWQELLHAVDQHLARGRWLGPALPDHALDAG